MSSAKEIEAWESLWKYLPLQLLACTSVPAGAGSKDSKQETPEPMSCMYGMEVSMLTPWAELLGAVLAHLRSGCRNLGQEKDNALFAGAKEGRHQLCKLSSSTAATTSRSVQLVAVTVLGLQRRTHTT